MLALRRALQPPGEPDQPLDLGVFLDQLAEVLFFFESLVERDVQPGRNQPVDLLDAGQGNAQHAAHVLDGRLGFHRAEGADLRHIGVAVLLAHVVDHLVAAILAEVDINVWRLGAIGVEESLEQQIVLDRADIAQPQDVADQRAAGRPAHRCRNSPLAGVADEIPDDQEIGCEAHPVDHAQLVVQPLLDRGRRGVAVALAQALLAELLQVHFGALLIGRLETRKLPLAQAEAAVVFFDSTGNPRRHPQRLVHAGQEVVHFRGTADVELIGKLTIVGHEAGLI